MRKPSKPPYEFESEAELIQRLKDPSTKKAVDKFFNDQSETVPDVVKKAVAGSTFRAFRVFDGVRPSVTFRNWATKYIQKTEKELIHIKKESDYVNYVHDATLSLCREWKRRMHSEMGYGRGAKLFNLVLKKFACLNSLEQEQRERLIELLHVPLDRYTIVGISKVAPELSIPKNATMSYIDELKYKEFQNVISKIAIKAKRPAIYYDILAWNMKDTNR